MADRFHFQVVTAERVVFENDIEQVSVPTAMGEITILPHHAPLVSLLSHGEMRIMKGKEEFLLAVSGGMLYVTKEKVILLADRAEHAHELDLERAEEARKRAEDMLKEKTLGEEEYATVSAALQKELARLRVARKHRSKHGSQLPK